MMKESAPWNHDFNYRLSTGRYYQFRLHHLDKCKLLRKTLEMCYEMYTSRRCARCCRLHVNVPSSADVFQCPHCGFRKMAPYTV
jgi:transposase